MDKTFVLIKPDCVKKHMTGIIITAIENTGLNITKMSQKVLTEIEAQNLYKEHRGKWHFNRNIKHIISGPVVIMEIVGEQALERCRKFVEDFRRAHEDVISLPKNLVHATSDPSRVCEELAAVGLNGQDLALAS